MGNNLKTIVYLTVNLINYHIYVGVHDVEGDPYVFDGYLGNGINRFQPSSIKHPKEPFHFAVKKYGFDAFRRFVLYVCDTRKEALRIEGRIVNEEFIKRSDTYNVALGGGAPPIKCRETFQYTVDGEFVNKYISILAASKTVQVDDSAIYFAIENKTTSGGFFWTDYYVEKLDITNFNNGKQTKTLYTYSETGEFVKEYSSIMDFVRYADVTLGVVQRAIKTKTKVRNQYVSLEKVDSFIREKTKKRQGDPVHQYTLSGEYIRSYNSVSEVVKLLGKIYQGIPRSIRLGGTCGGFQWSWDKFSSMGNKEKNVAIAKKIGQYTLDGKLVKVYDTLRACRKDFGNVGKVLKGQAKLAKGFTFKYMD